MAKTTKPTITLSSTQLTKFANAAARHAMGARAFNAAIKGRGRWQAVCGDHFWTTWFGPCRPTLKLAKADATAHNAATVHHAFAIGPIICDDDDERPAARGVKRKRA